MKRLWINRADGWRLYSVRDVYHWFRASRWPQIDKAVGMLCYTVYSHETGEVVGVCTEA